MTTCACEDGFSTAVDPLFILPAALYPSYWTCPSARLEKIPLRRLSNHLRTCAYSLGMRLVPYSAPSNPSSRVTSEYYSWYSCNWRAHLCVWKPSGRFVGLRRTVTQNLGSFCANDLYSCVKLQRQLAARERRFCWPWTAYCKVPRTRALYSPRVKIICASVYIPTTHTRIRTEVSLPPTRWMRALITCHALSLRSYYVRKRFEAEMYRSSCTNNTF